MKLISKATGIILILGLGHGLNDMIAGYFLGKLVHINADWLQISVGLFIYNLLAFGGQYPFALLLERVKTPKKFLMVAYGLNIGALISFSFFPQLSIVMAGVASALYHVAGGTICAEKNRATSIGLFSAPGVTGLILGGYFAYENINVLSWLMVGAVFIFGFLAIIPRREGRLRLKVNLQAEPARKFQLDNHDIIMILLLTIISLRSVVWNVFQLIHAGNYSWLIAIALSASIGKIAGGRIADLVGWRLYTFLALGFATPLITFFKDELLLFCLGIGLLQSSIPSTTSLLIQSLKGKTERAIGLSFGVAIIAGAVLFYTPLRDLLMSNYFIWITGAIMLLLLFFAYNKKVRRMI